MVSNRRIFRPITGNHGRTPCGSITSLVLVPATRSTRPRTTAQYVSRNWENRKKCRPPLRGPGSFPAGAAPGRSPAPELPRDRTRLGQLEPAQKILTVSLQLPNVLDTINQLNEKERPQRARTKAKGDTSANHFPGTGREPNLRSRHP